MISSVKEWNEKIKKLKGMILREDHIVEATELILDLHQFVHTSSVSSIDAPTYEDELWERCSTEEITRFSQGKIYSIAWHLWHSARIEDISLSHFLLDEEEIYHGMDFQSRMSLPFGHTGNSMSYGEMELFNSKIDIEELKSYRFTVGRKARKALSGLTTGDLKRKVTPESLEGIRKQGSVAAEDSWLLSFWGKKNIAGIVTMPFTRHLLVHLNSAFRLT